MKISRDIKKYADNLDNIVEDIVNDTLEYAWEQVIEKAPIDTGEYVSSIQIENATKKGFKIKGRVYSDLKVITKSGESYLLGELLENGTRPHAIPNAFGWGWKYGFESPQYERTLDPDWHPGFRPIPHWQPAYDKASIKFDRLIKEKL